MYTTYPKPSEHYSSEEIGKDNCGSWIRTYAQLLRDHLHLQIAVPKQGNFLKGLYCSSQVHSRTQYARLSSHTVKLDS